MLNKPYHGDVFEFLAQIPDNFVQTCVTSPPYYGKRNYKIPPRIWDADPTCEHEWSGKFFPPTKMAQIKEGMEVGKHIDPKWSGPWTELVGSHMCMGCGGWRGVLGEEPLPEMFVDHLVQIFREVRRVMRPDGTLWLNLGDSAVDSGGTWSTDKRPGREDDVLLQHRIAAGGTGRPPSIGIASKFSHYKKKDLFGIPWMTAFALRNDGWYLRQDIIWSKPNNYPEPVRDRPTRSHEYIFLMSKQPQYYYDHYAVYEPLKFPDATGVPFRKGSWGEGAHTGLNDEGRVYNAKDLQLHLKAMGGNKDGEYHGVSAGDPAEAGAQNPSDMKRRILQSAKNKPIMGKNRRSVWTITTKGENWNRILPPTWEGQKHFAAYPTDLVELCIKAGTSFRACGCGNPYERVIEKSYDNPGRDQASQGDWRDGGAGSKEGGMNTGKYPTGKRVATIKWEPRCGAPYERVVKSPKIDDPGRNEDADYQKFGDDVKTWDGHRQLGGNYQKEMNKNPKQTTGWQPTCGAPYRRVVEREFDGEYSDSAAEYQREANLTTGGVGRSTLGKHRVTLRKNKGVRNSLLGWEKSCKHEDGCKFAKCVVLDPFMGTFTTAVVAEQLGRDWLGCDVNENFIELGKLRLNYYRKQRGFSVKELRRE